MILDNMLRHIKYLSHYVVSSWFHNIKYLILKFNYLTVVYKYNYYTCIKEYTSINSTTT